MKWCVNINGSWHALKKQPRKRQDFMIFANCTIVETACGIKPASFTGRGAKQEPTCAKCNTPRQHRSGCTCKDCCLKRINAPAKHAGRALLPGPGKE